MISTAVSVAIIIAIVGWLATIFAISRSSLSRTWKRNLLIPSWIPWLALALGAPILSGLIPVPADVEPGPKMGRAGLP